MMRRLASFVVPIAVFASTVFCGSPPTPQAVTHEGGLEVRNPRGSTHGPGAPCKDSGECAQVSCQCNDVSRMGLSSGICRPDGVCQSASVLCSAPCAEGRGAKYALVHGDLEKNQDCKSICSTIESLGCGTLEKKCAFTSRCVINGDECVTTAKARLACQAKQTWTCNQDLGVALPKDQAACMNLDVTCPPDDPAPTPGSVPGAFMGSAAVPAEVSAPETPPKK